MVVPIIGCQGRDMGDMRGYWMHMAAVCGGTSLQIVLKGVRSPPRPRTRREEEVLWARVRKFPYQAALWPPLAPQGVPTYPKVKWPHAKLART
jgi:hypothetical protein